MNSLAAYDSDSSPIYQRRALGAHSLSSRGSPFDTVDVPYKHGTYIVSVPANTYDNIEHVSNDGAFGIIFRGNFREASLDVIIKKQSLESPADCEASVRELSVLSHLRMSQNYHPNITFLLDAWEYNDCLYIVLPLRKFSLDEFIQNQRSVTVPSDRMNLFRQILYGINHLHNNEILHRDLKPGNIVLSDDLRVEIIDFGASRLFLDRVQQTKGKYVCTYPYRPPEADVGLFFKSSDVWSAGCILVELISGKRMFDGEEDILAFDRLQVEKRLAALEDEATAFELMILRSIFELDPEKRTSVEQLLHAIENQPAKEKLKSIMKNDDSPMKYKPPQYTYDSLQSMRQSISCLLESLDRPYV